MSEDSALTHSHVTSPPADDRDKAGRIPMPRTPPGTPGMPFQPGPGRAASSRAPGGEGSRAPRGAPLHSRWPSQGRGFRCRRRWHPHPDTHIATVPCRPAWGSGHGTAARPAAGPSPSHGQYLRGAGNRVPIHQPISPWQGRAGSAHDMHAGHTCVPAGPNLHGQGRPGARRVWVTDVQPRATCCSFSCRQTTRSCTVVLLSLKT